MSTLTTVVSADDDMLVEQEGDVVDVDVTVLVADAEEEPEVSDTESGMIWAGCSCRTGALAGALSGLGPLSSSDG